ncbi:MAG: hypothetical protein HEEMFOPI_00682 [Holosporales bacterium]
MLGFVYGKAEPKKEQPSCEPVTEASCAAMVAKKAGPNGFAVSGLFGLMTADSRITTPEGLDISAKNTYKRLGLGIAYYNTFSNNVFWGAGLDLITNLGHKTVDAVGEKDVIYMNEQNKPIGKGKFNSPIKYKQRRPFTAALNAKLGYAYGDFCPYAMLTLRQTYVVHDTTIVSDNSKQTDRDVNFGLQPGLGFMYKMGNFGIGAEYGYHKETTFGLEGKAGDNGDVKTKGCHSFSVRLTYFL